MASDAQKRINTIAQFSELGAGIHIAMKDLEIRGAGDLLGGEQSGFINEIGFETYQKILEEAIDELKENEFKTLFEDQDKSLEKNYVKEVQIDTDFEILFPDDYINVVNERLVLYNELSAIKDEEAEETWARWESQNATVLMQTHQKQPSGLLQFFHKQA